MKAALKDAYAVYAVTNYWEIRSEEVEMKQGKAIADAAKVCQLEQYGTILIGAHSKLASNTLFGALYSTSLSVGIVV